MALEKELLLRKPLKIIAIEKIAAFLEAGCEFERGYGAWEVWERPLNLSCHVFCFYQGHKTQRLTSGRRGLRLAPPRPVLGKLIHVVG